MLPEPVEWWIHGEVNKKVYITSICILSEKREWKNAKEKGLFELKIKNNICIGSIITVNGERNYD